MKFTPKTEEEIQEAMLLPEGDYDFQVMTAEDTISKSGNDMIKLKLKVFRPSGGEAHIYDYLLEKMEFKLRHFCEAVGILDKYEDGTLTSADCDGRAGKVAIYIQAGKDGFGPKNSVSDYVVPDTQHERRTKVSHAAMLEPKPLEIRDDDIPF